MNYILFDPAETWENLLPLTWTRPVSEIRIGILTIREKWERLLGTKVSWLTRDYLQEEFPARLENENILINGSVLPDKSLVRDVSGLKSGEMISSRDIFIAVRLGRQEITDFNPSTWTGGALLTAEMEPGAIAFPWDIFRLNGEAIESDFTLLTDGRKSEKLSPTNHCPETGNIFLEQGARVEYAVLNTGTGPIYIAKDAEIMEGAMVRGPFVLGEGSTLKMGSKIYGPTTIGPMCKAAGEIKNSVIFGYSNKAHEGFLGNSVIGQWCNIGADTNNSNLKNNYAMVKLWNYREERFIDSGLQFCGLIMGDHSKCGINTMFNTGTVVGINANIYGDGFPRNFIPSFSWGGAHGFTTFLLDKAFEVAGKVMERKNLKLSDSNKKLLSTVFELTEKYRS
jgi:UDP-N-acetylglucosamine diphosphorylase/glucosamine-1-phosphate N-acetyltransferase